MQSNYYQEVCLSYLIILEFTLTNFIMKKQIPSLKDNTIKNFI
jgi:hypothetical protein